MIAILLLLGLQDEEALRASVNRALPLLQKSGAEYPRQRGCFSCHHQTLPILALTTARARGFAIDEKQLGEAVEFTAKSLARGLSDYRKGKGQGGEVDTAASALWTLELGGRAPDDMTAAVASYLLGARRDEDHWSPTSRRPPIEASPLTSTWMTLRALKTYGPAAQAEAIAKRTEAAKSWLLAVKPADTEEHVSRLRALKDLGADVKEATRDLRELQRDDGGWAQLKTLESDAYATGSALVALHAAGGLKSGDEAYRKGVRFLLSTQKEDGSWLVKTRAKPIQSYFESGFPHGKDQFISIAATSWAATAIALSCGR